MSRLILLCILPLISCVANPPVLTTGVVTQEVGKPVVQKCITDDKIPPKPPTHFISNGSDKQNADGASADLRLYVPYATELEAQLRKCSKSQTE